MQNEKYLRDHPEVDVLIQGFISEACKTRPKNVREFAATYFQNTELPLQVTAQTQNKLSTIKYTQSNESE